MFDPQALLRRLGRAQTDFVVGGGVAVAFHRRDPGDQKSRYLSGSEASEPRALGSLDLMQWIPGIDADHAYDTLAGDAPTIDRRGQPLMVCSLDHLRVMKRTAGRPQDLQDLRDLELALGDG